ncbi:MAG: hypothetical protein AAGD35_22525 [Actinomycetota bacterium]
MADARNATDIARSVVGDGHQPLVLEPSPPAVTVEPFADDPLAVDGGDGDGTAVYPFAEAPDGGVTWRELAAGDDAVAEVAERLWLGPWKRLEPLPDQFAATRLSLHRVAAYVMSPARRLVNGKIGLRYTTGGFGTPFFVDPDDESVSVQVRVTDGRLVLQRGDEAAARPITTLSAAGAFVGVAPDVGWASQFDIPEPGDLDADLAIDEASAIALGHWYGFAYSVLEELRADTASVDASNPQLWPEHFDPAIEAGSDEAKHRASIGFSPGDAEGGIQTPYVYVAAWYRESLGDDPFWNSTTYPGARLDYADLIQADDQRATALAFLRKGRDLLASA